MQPGSRFAPHRRDDRLAAGVSAAAAWIAAVGADSMRTGDVRFQPFEESWVITENAATIVDRPSLTSLALVPVDGDEAMGVRLTKVLLHETALRVVTPTRQHGPLLVTMAPRERAVLARQALP